MGISALISIALGILSVMILFSLVATAIQETIAQLLNTRGRRLRDGIAVLLEKNFPEEIDAQRCLSFFYNEFYQAADLQALTTRTPSNKILRAWEASKQLLRGGQKKLPSAIEPRRYAETIFKLLGTKTERNALALEAKSVVEQSEKQLLDELKSVSEALGGETLPTVAKTTERIGATLNDVADEIQARITRAQSLVEARLQELEEEFNETMDRVSGWYTRQTKLTLFIIGFFLAMGANIDIIGYADRLLSDESLRNKAEIYAQLLGASNRQQQEQGMAENRGKETPPAAGDEDRDPGISPESLQALVVELDSLDVRIGWCAPYSTAPNDTQAASDTTQAASDTAPDRSDRSQGLCRAGEELHWPPSASQIVGWFLIGFGVTLGGQFWFNLLKKLLDLRTSGRVRGTRMPVPRAQR